MGESILRDREIPFESARSSDRAAYRKGIGLIFPNRDVDTVRQRKRTQRRQRGPREEFSFLFNSFFLHPWNRITRREGGVAGKAP